MIYTVGSYDLQSTIHRHQIFWARETYPTPILAEFPRNTKLPSWFLPQEDKRLEPSDLDFEKLVVGLEGLLAVEGGLDAPPTVIPSLEVPWTEAISGCSIRVSSSDLWASGSETNSSVLEAREISIREPWMEKLIQAIKILERNSHERYVVCPSHVRGPTDVAGAGLGHDQMVLMMIDDPQQLRSTFEAYTEVAVELARRELSNVSRYDGGNFNRFGLWAPGKTIVFQEDGAVLLSPRLYEDIVLQFDIELAQETPYAVMHLHSPCAGFVVPLLLDSRVYASIQVRVDPSGPSVQDLLPLFKRIQRSRSLMISGDFSCECLEWLVENLQAGWLQLYVPGDSIRKYCQKHGVG